MRQLILSLLFFQVSSFNCLFAQTESFYCTGAIDGKYKIQMTIYIEGEKAQGDEYYENVGEYINLSGNYDNKTSNLVLHEFDGNGQTTGIFKGRLTKNNSLYSGEWFSGDGNKKRSFELVRKVKFKKLIKTEKGHKASVNYPIFESNSPAFIKINKEIENKSIETTENFIKTALEDELIGIERDYESDNNIAVHYYSDDLVSMLIDIYETTSGAHGNYYFEVLNYKIENNSYSKVELKKLFKKNSDWLKKLNALIIADLIKQEASSIVSGEITEFKEEKISNFTFNSKYINFYFAPYQVGCFVEGDFKTSVNYKQIKEIIDPQGPIGKFIK